MTRRSLPSEMHRSRSSLLRGALKGNGAFSALSGVTMLVASGPLANAFGIPGRAILLALGAVLLAFAAQLLTAARRGALRPREVGAFTTLDLLWVAGSALLLLLGGPLTLAGKWAVALVADAVLAFAVLQLVGLRRLRRAEGGDDLAPA